MATYGDSETYKRLYDKSSDSDDEDIVAALEAVADYLDDRLGYPEGFILDTAPTERLYTVGADPNGAALTVIRVSPIASRTGLLIRINNGADGDFDAETDLDETDYQLLPLNADKGRRPRPWTRIRIPSWSSVGAWPIDTLVRVTAIHGWPGGTPRAIIQAVYDLTAILRLESPRAERTMTELNGTFATSTRANNIIDDLIGPYGRIAIG